MASLESCNMHHFLALFSLLFMATTSWISRGLAANVLISEPDSYMPLSTLMVKQYLNASNFYLVMQPDCNLVIYNSSRPFLTSKLERAPEGPSSTWNCYATMQADGQFVVYQRLNSTSKIQIWAADSFNTGGYTNNTYRILILDTNGSLRMFSPDGSNQRVTTFIPVYNASLQGAPSPAPVSPNITSNIAYPFPPELAWKPNISLDGFPYMPAQYFLTQGSKLQTINKRFVLTLGHDCKLQSQEIWRVNNTVKGVVWEPEWSGMSGVVRGNCQLVLQQDGRLEICNNDSGVVYWNSSMGGDNSVSWVLKLDTGDGHVSVLNILDSSNVLWTSLDAVMPRNDATVWPIVVGVMGGVLFVALLVALAFWYFYLRARFADPNEKAFRSRLQSIGGISKVWSQAKIKQATNNFGKKIGYGGSGDVFYGKLPNGQEIAAKVLTRGSHQSKQEFYNEIELLSVVHHKYLVSLLGYSSTWKHQILIYEYMSGGDLRHRLQGKGAAKNPLTWKERTSITLQVAEGLEYLHNKCSPAIIHRDVKSDNILLTSRLLVAKVADFGLSKLRTIDQENATHITTVVKGTPGYLDPEYHEKGMLTEKSDVYAFGIVLMEILTGQHQMSIAHTVNEAWRSGEFDNLADPKLGGEYDKDEFVSLVEWSLWCVRKRSLDRPFMREVVQKLQELNYESVMTIGADDLHSEDDTNSLEVSLCRSPSSNMSSSTFEVSGFVK